MIWDDGTCAITEKELMVNLHAIRHDASQASAEEAAQKAVGVLTTEHRVEWAKLRSILKTDRENADVLAMVG